MIDYVLKKPSPEHRVEIEKSIEQALSGLDLLLAGDMERATMKINARPPRPKPPAPSGQRRSRGRRRDRAGTRRRLLLLAAAGGAAAQSAVYRCGNEYSRTPCSQGKVVDTQNSARTAAQRAEAVRVAASEKQLAEDMARDRRRAEAANRPAAAGSLGPTRPAASATAKTSAAGKGKNKGKKKGGGGDGEDFVADVPGAKT